MTETQQAMAELPRYKCHKEVWAVKIAEVQRNPPVPTDAHTECDPNSNGGTIIPANERYGPIEVTAGYLRKHRPEVGGYYVVYKGGYRSYSPADAFEDGYTLIT